MPYVKLNGICLYYEEFGHGQPIICLHGLTSSIAEFESFKYILGNRYRVILPDLRGHGKSDKPLSYSLNDHVMDIISLCEYLKLDKINLMGVSMGSYVGIGLGIELGDRLNKLILVSSKSFGKESSTEVLFRKHEHEWGNKDLTHDEKFSYLQKYIYHNVEAIEENNKRLAPFQIELTKTEIKAAKEALQSFDFRDGLSKITAKTLIINGQYDGLNPPEAGMTLFKGIEKSEFIVFDQSGHNPMVEEKDLFIEKLMEFLNSKDI